MTTGPHELHEDERGQWECYCCGRLESQDGAALIAGDAFAGHVRVDPGLGRELLARQLRQEDKN